MQDSRATSLGFSRSRAQCLPLPLRSAPHVLCRGRFWQVYAGCTIFRDVAHRITFAVSASLCGPSPRSSSLPFARSPIPSHRRARLSASPHHPFLHPPCVTTRCAFCRSRQDKRIRETKRPSASGGYKTAVVDGRARHTERRQLRKRFYPETDTDHGEIGAGRFLARERDATRLTDLPKSRTILDIGLHGALLVADRFPLSLSLSLSLSIYLAYSQRRENGVTPRARRVSLTSRISPVYSPR